MAGWHATAGWLIDTEGKGTEPQADMSPSELEGTGGGLDPD